MTFAVDWTLDFECNPATVLKDSTHLLYCVKSRSPELIVSNLLSYVQQFLGSQKLPQGIRCLASGAVCVCVCVCVCV